MTLMERSTIVRHRALQRVGGVTIDYVRGATVIEHIKAVAGNVRAIDYGSDPIELTGRERDWLLLTTDLLLGNEPIMPERGDVVLWTDSAGVPHKYEVLPRTGERCYRHCDQTMTQLRIFTVEVAT